LAYVSFFLCGHRVLEENFFRIPLFFLAQEDQSRVSSFLFPLSTAVKLFSIMHGEKGMEAFLFFTLLPFSQV